MTIDNNKNHLVKTVPVKRLEPDAEQLSPDTRELIEEAPLTIEIQDVGAYTIMCTPGDALALAVGFVFSEGLISSRDDIHVLMKCPDDPNVIRMHLAQTDKKETAPRRLLIVSSCGICGSKDMDELLRSLPVVPQTLRISPAELTTMPQMLSRRQQLFKRTGGTHAAGIVRDGKMIAACEDLGRHTAFDKALGTCLLSGLTTTGAAVVLSGRVSWELVAKAARAGIELIAAVSAPSYLALQAAQRSNITLCGFVRGKEATIYSHHQRITQTP